jgi:hypothetical protein
VGSRHARGMSAMKRRLGCAMLLALGIGVQSTNARARDPEARRWAIGLEASWLGAPHGHLGYAPSSGASALSGEVVARFRLLNALAIDAGFGLPHAAMGLSGWGAVEVFGTALANPTRTLALEVYQQAGLQLGYAGPDYFARSDNEFVGYGYTTAGPLSFAVRFPAGINLRWLRGAVDSYTEIVPIMALTPRREMLYTMATGIRWRF